MRKGIIKNKRAQFQLGALEIFFVIAFLFSTAIFLVILFYSWSQISTPFEDAINSVIPGETAYNVTQFNDKVSVGVTSFNVLFPFLIVGLVLFVIVSAFFANSHPMFLFISIVILGITILLGAIFGNIFQQLTVTTALSESASDFNIINIFMKNFPLIMVVIGVITIFVLIAYGRGRGATGGL